MVIFIQFVVFFQNYLKVHFHVLAASEMSNNDFVERCGAERAWGYGEGRALGVSSVFSGLSSHLLAWKSCLYLKRLQKEKLAPVSSKILN